MKVNNKNIFITSILFIILFICFYVRHNLLEGFETQQLDNKQLNNKQLNNRQIHQFMRKPWSQDLKSRFLKYQNTMNRNDFKYNLEMLEQQVSPNEIEEYIKTGYWNWDDDLKKLYIEKVSSSNLVKIMPIQSLNYAMRMYTPDAAKQLLAWNYKEGEFLLYGGKTIDGNNIQCSSDPEPILKETINGELTDVKNENIPNIMPGFSFINKPCNPCVSLKYPMDKSCPFKLNMKKTGNETSLIWKKIWGL